MREPETKDCGGRRYKIGLLPAGQGLAVLTRLARLAGPALAGLDKLDSLGVEQLLALVGPALGTALQRLDPADLEFVLRTLAEQSAVEVEAGNFAPLAKRFETHFAGAYEELFAWAYAALQVQFGPLFSALVRRAASAMPPAAPTASTTTASR